MIRWYTVPCEEQFCFQHLHATKGMGIGAAARVWQEQTNHKLVRHLASDLLRSRKRAGSDGMAKSSIGCCPVIWRTKWKECLIRSLRRRQSSGFAAVSRRHSISPQSLIPRTSLFCVAAIVLLLSLSIVMVIITTLITKGVVEVEFGLAGIIQRHKICQD